VRADGTTKVESAPASHAAAVDCFYVYPTVSEEKRRNADLRVQPAQTHVAMAQASRFSSVCRVWAPMYRQRTVSNLFDVADVAPDSVANLTAFHSVESAWLDYLAHHNHGRPVVFIGHSQGAAMLVRLLRADVDPRPNVRAKVALAILLGANVTVHDGRLAGGSFTHLPLCTRRGEAGCVIAYSSFPATPPSFSLFGRAGLGVSALSGETTDGSTHVACVNPAGFGRGREPLHPYFPSDDVDSRVSTPWTSDPDDYTAQCRSADGATWLQVSPVRHPADGRPELTTLLGPIWGYHVIDVNVALGDLVRDAGATVAQLP
jgi:hypothetical protein